MNHLTLRQACWNSHGAEPLTRWSSLLETEQRSWLPVVCRGPRWHTAQRTEGVWASERPCPGPAPKLALGSVWPSNQSLVGPIKSRSIAIEWRRGHSHANSLPSWFAAYHYWIKWRYPHTNDFFFIIILVRFRDIQGHSSAVCLLQYRWHFGLKWEALRTKGPRKLLLLP